MRARSASNSATMESGEQQPPDRVGGVVDRAADVQLHFPHCRHRRRTDHLRRQRLPAPAPAHASAAARTAGVLFAERLSLDAVAAWTRWHNLLRPRHQRRPGVAWGRPLRAPPPRRAHDPPRDLRGHHPPGGRGRPGRRLRRALAAPRVRHQRPGRRRHRTRRAEPRPLEEPPVDGPLRRPKPSATPTPTPPACSACEDMGLMPG